MEESLPHAVVSALLRGDTERAERLASGREAALVEWACAHRLEAVLHAMARPGGPLREVLAPGHLLAHADELERLSWVPRLLERIGSRGAEVFVFKGLGLAHDARLYSSAELRPLGDLDLLVRPQDLDRAIDAAEECGFVPAADDPAVDAFARHENYQFALEHPRHGLLELHHALYRDIPTRATRDMLARAVSATVYGQRVRRLADPDLFYVLCVHLARAGEIFIWAWLMDLALLSRVMSPDDWRVLEARTLEWGGQVFVLACLEMLAAMWSERPPALPPGYLTGLRARLSFIERRALQAYMARLPAGPLGGEGLVVARRFSMRPGRRAGVFRALVCHPGVVCLEMGVRSEDPQFWWHRTRHVGSRLRRLLRIGKQAASAGK